MVSIINIQMIQIQNLMFYQLILFYLINIVFIFFICCKLMFSSAFTRNLRSIDFYKNIPSEYSQGTISGACISLVSIISLLLLTLSALTTYMTPIFTTDLIIDQKHSSDKLKVYIDIEFHKFPCGLLSLDVQNILKVHDVNVRQGLRKITIPGQMNYDDANLDHETIRKNIYNQFKNQQGCRLVGNFWIDRVPGNFHISTHGYNVFINVAFEVGIRKFDLSHTINELYFGDEKPQLDRQNTLKGFKSDKQIPEAFMGITYTYFLQIIESNTIHSNGYHRQSFYYTTRVNEVIMNTIPMVFFQYSTNSMTEIEIGQYFTWKDLLIDVVAIIGGIFTVSSIIDQMIHSSIHYLIKKQQLGKLA